MEINVEKTVYGVKLKQDAIYGLTVSIFWIAAAVFMYALGALIVFFEMAELLTLIALLLWILGTAFGLIGLFKGIKLVWQNWD